MKEILVCLLEDSESQVIEVEEHLKRVGTVVRLALQEYNLKLVVVRNGVQCLQYLEGLYTVPNLLILDLVVPLKDGFEVLEEVRQHRQYKEMPIIILTQYGAEAEKRLAAKLGAAGYEVKEGATEPDKLGNQIVELIARYAAEYPEFDGGIDDDTWQRLVEEYGGVK